MNITEVLAGVLILILTFTGGAYWIDGWDAVRVGATVVGFITCACIGVVLIVHGTDTDL